MAGSCSKMHYLNGKAYNGSVHKMPNGECHTGSKHSKSSKKLAHSKPRKKKK